jgi:hypothetical protein
MNQSDRAGTPRAFECPGEFAALQHRLGTYALSAATAGVAVMACSVAADAAPICKHSSVVLESQSFPLNPAGQRISPFEIADTFNNVCSQTGCSWNRGFLTPNAPFADPLLAPNGFPANLPFGASVGPGGQFGGGREYGLLFTYGPWAGGDKNHHRGNFDFSKDNYFGFKFSISSQTHYGWVRLSVTVGGGYGNLATIINVLEYAYESNPNTVLPAGACSTAEASSATGAAPHGVASREDASGSAAPIASGVQTPPPASLGMLALGAQGIPLWRRR